jgi:hypothetical protein
MLCLLKAAALGAVLSMNVLTLSSAPARPRSAQMLDANVYVPERLTQPPRRSQTTRQEPR